MPPIYVINLDRDVERMTSLAGSLRALGLDYVRVPAVLGREVPGWENLVDAGRYAARNRNAMPRPGEVGCYLSHLKVMEAFLRTDAPWCVILEDDVEVRPECVEVLRALAEKDDWDLAKLFCFHAGMPVRKRALTPTHHLVVHLTRTTSSAAYAVNRRAAETLLRTMRPITEQVDHALDRPWETGLRVRGVRPLPVVLAPVAATTTIGYADRGDRRLPLRRALRLFVSRAGKEIRRFANGLAEGFLARRG
ncbi:MAG: glycosyltransferase family 25 protein [Verrucomicrobia bacterium]|nr:glycosyltransferase family 25 protein [Verrucomicrobiota bacterium]